MAMFSRDQEVSPEALARGTRQLSHRGPDGERRWIAPHRRIGLGHTRLSIIDLTTGEQPIANETEQLRIVVNGEFYGFEAIQRELEGQGHRLRTRSDSEIALHLYEERGARCLERLRGEFAFILWDEANRQVFAARDRFGVKPLYYAVVDGTLYLASEVKALFAAGVPARWDDEAFYDYLHLGLNQDASLFRGVYQVPPGHYLLATENRLQLVRYWDLDYPTIARQPARRSDEDYIADMRGGLEDAIRVRLRADVPVGCYLSGGIDSSAVLGMAAQMRSDPIAAFTICFDDDSYDEGAIALATAKHVGATYHPVRVTEAMLADHFADSIWNSELPTGNLHGVAMFILSKAVRDLGYKVVLTGEGSDDLLAGYAHFRRDIILAADSAETPEHLANLEAIHKKSRGYMPLPEIGGGDLPSVRRTLGFVPSFFSGRAAYGAGFHPFFSSGFAARFAERDPYRVYLNRFDVAGQLAGREAINQSLSLWARTGLVSYLLNVVGDRMQMAHSIEGRLPFLDHQLFERVRDTPIGLKLRGETEKYLLREAARPVLTDAVYRRVKQPFVSPPFGLDSHGKILTMVRDSLSSRVLAAQPFFDPAAVRSVLDRIPEMGDAERRPVSDALTVVVGVCALQERFALAAP